MKPIAILFLCFLLIPIGEIYLLIRIGDVIGAGWTVVGVVSTALIGAWLVKLQGVLTAQKALSMVRAGELPAIQLIEGLFLLVAGALLITPGFVTDTIGFLCLTPSLRRLLAAKILSRIVIHVKSKTPSEDSKTYETTYREIKD